MKVKDYTPNGMFGEDELNNETWVKCEELPRVWVSTLGRICRYNPKWKCRMIGVGRVRKDGYCVVYWCDKLYYTHRIVAHTILNNDFPIECKNVGRELEVDHSEAQIGKTRVFSEEHRRNLSLSQKGRPSPNKGIPMSEEQKQKISISNRGQKRTEEARRKMSLASTGRVVSNETKEKHRIAMLKIWEERRNKAKI